MFGMTMLSHDVFGACAYAGRVAATRVRLFALALSLLCSVSSAASVYVVNSTADTSVGAPANCLASSQSPCQLRDAVAAANATSGATITFDGSVFATAQTIALSAANGPLTPNTSMTITGPGVNALSISGDDAVTVFVINQADISGVMVNLSQVRITGGNSNSTTNGGGIVIGGGVVSIDNVDISGNTNVCGGGGIYVEDGTVTVSNSSVTDNAVQCESGAGGIVINQGVATIVGSSISNNTNSYGVGGIVIAQGVSNIGGGTSISGNEGGGIGVYDATVDVKGVMVADSVGRGISLFGQGLLTIEQCTIAGNSLGGTATFGGTMMISGSTVSNNMTSYSGTADYGGAGIASYGGATTIANSTIYGNTVAGDTGLGGGVLAYGGALSIFNSTISANSASLGTGVMIGGNGPPSSLLQPTKIANSIVDGNLVDGEATDIFINGEFLDGGGNLIGTGTSELGALAGNGGPTLTSLPTAASGAICQGLIANIPDGVATDQRGQPRATDASCVDSGAVQTGFLHPRTPTTLYVTSSEEPSYFNSAYLTVTVAGANPTGTVSFTVQNSSEIYYPCPLQPLSNGQAHCFIQSLPIGSTIVSALYSGDANNASSNGTLTQVVTDYPVTVRVSTSVNPAQVGQTVLFQAAVDYEGLPVTGTVTFKDGDTPICTDVPVTQSNSFNTANCTVRFPTAGVIHTITAVYAGNRAAEPVTSDKFVQYVVDGFVPLSPARILDTRVGGTTIDGHFGGLGAVAAGRTLDLSVIGRGGVPSAGIKAVVLNVTVTNPTAPGYVTVWQSGNPLPFASNLNFVPGETVPNLVIAKVSDLGSVSLFNSSGSTDLIADVVGYFTDQTDFVPVTPQRLLDTRRGATTVDAQFASVGALTGQSQLNLPISGRGGVPTTGAGAVVLNVTVTDPTAAGYVSIWPSGSAQPLASNLNFVPSQTVANLVISELSSAGEVSFFNSAGNTDLIADVVGWFPAASQLTPLIPARLLDTRAGAVTTDGQFAGNGALGVNELRDLLVSGRGNVPASGVNAVVLNVTVTNPTAAGYLTVWPSGDARPLASNLNFVPGQTAPNLVIAKVGSDGKISVFNSAGSTDIVVDVVGWFSGTP